MHETLKAVEHQESFNFTFPFILRETFTWLYFEIHILLLHCGGLLFSGVQFSSEGGDGLVFDVVLDFISKYANENYTGQKTFN